MSEHVEAEFPCSAGQEHDWALVCQRCGMYQSERHDYARLAEAARRVTEAGKHPCFCGGDEEYATGEEPHLPFCPVGLAIRALAEALGDGR